MLAQCYRVRKANAEISGGAPSRNSASEYPYIFSRCKACQHPKPQLMGSFPHWIMFEEMPKLRIQVDWVHDSISNPLHLHSLKNTRELLATCESSIFG